MYVLRELREKPFSYDDWMQKGVSRAPCNASAANQLRRVSLGCTLGESTFDKSLVGLHAIERGEEFVSCIGCSRAEARTKEVLSGC